MSWSMENERCCVLAVFFPSCLCGCGYPDGLACDSDLRSTRTAAAATTGCCCAISERRGRGKIRTSAAQQNTTPPKHHQNTNRKKLKYREQKYNKDMVHRVRASQFLFIGRSGQTCHRFFFFFVLLGPNAVCALCAERILWAVMDNTGGG
jgi:hypothetical protein